jgi:hypothetical protein
LSVNIGSDNLYRTPVFGLIAGETSCPHEPPTVPRDAIQFTLSTNFQQVNLPATSAILNASITNVSTVTTDPNRTFIVALDNSSNLDGAVVKLGGFQIGGNNYQQFTIPTGQSINPVLEILRGPLAYDYNGLRLIVFAACDLSSYLSGGGVNVLGETSLSVSFESPCSEITLFNPEDEWLVNAADNDQLLVTLTGYTASLLTDVEVQYIQPGISGSWNTLGTVLAADLLAAGSFYDLLWDVSSVLDGPYRLRAKANCGSGFTYSEVVDGYIDRESLLPIGTPEPADGVLSLGDDISVSFTEDIFCPQASAQSVNLFFTSDNSSIVPGLTCGGNLIDIDALTTDCLLEDRYVTARVFDLVDINGNPQTQEVLWTFLVDRYPNPAVSGTVTGVSGPGATDGAINISVSGGSGPYSYAWSNGATTEDLSGLPADTFTVVVSDANCSKTTTSFIVDEPLNCGPDPFEPNDSKATAANLGNGVLQFAKDNKRICGMGDVDWYQVNVPAGNKTLKVWIQNLPADYQMELHNDIGLIATSANPGLQDEMIQLQGAFGNYYIKVYGANDAWNPTQSYELIHTILTPAPSGTPVKPNIIAPIFKAGDPVFKAYPIPASTELIIEFESAIQGMAIASLTDVTGRELISRNVKVSEGLMEDRISLKGIADGTYFLELRCGDRSWNRKVVVVKD